MKKTCLDWFIKHSHFIVYPVSKHIKFNTQPLPLILVSKLHTLYCFKWNEIRLSIISIDSIECVLKVKPIHSSAHGAQSASTITTTTTTTTTTATTQKHYRNATETLQKPHRHPTVALKEPSKNPTRTLQELTRNPTGSLHEPEKGIIINVVIIACSNIFRKMHCFGGVVKLVTMRQVMPKLGTLKLVRERLVMKWTFSTIFPCNLSTSIFGIA